MKIACCLALAVSSVSATAAEKASAKPVPPEVEKTVAALAGRWSLTTTMTAPGAAPVTFPQTVDCKRAVMGRAVACVDTWSAPGVGAAEYRYLIGYDVETSRVHLFSMGSPGEVHDHTCGWKSDTMLECDPHVATMGGLPSTETVSFVFSANTMTFDGTTTGPDGAVVIHSKGTRGR
jgi:hypothetical protein